MASNADRILELANRAKGLRAEAQRCDNEITSIRASALTSAMDRVRVLEAEIRAIRATPTESKPHG